MVPQEALLVAMVKLVDRIPIPPAPAKRGRGRPPTYSDRLFLKALIIMIVRHLHSAYELYCVLQQPSPEMLVLRNLLCEHGRFPARRTWERRLAALPERLPAQIRCLGTQLVELIQPWVEHGRAVAADSTVLRAKGGVWHKKDRDAEVVPHTSIDTEAHWTKSGWHGWVYGWKLHLLTVVGKVWLPLAAELTAANVDDGTQAAKLLWWEHDEIPPDVRYILGDKHYNSPLMRAVCAVRGWWLVATKHGRYPHKDAGVEVRRIFHKLRSLAIENFNQHFKGIFGGHAQVPTRGLVATRRWALGAIFVYQVALLYRYEQGLDLNVGLKAFLKAA